jgi:hypothetical protein
MLWQRLDGGPNARRLTRLRAFAIVLACGAGLALATVVAGVYVTLPAAIATALLAVSGLLFLGGMAAYLIERRPAHAAVWPS